MTSPASQPPVPMRLVLEDGSEHPGIGFASHEPVAGEVVFNTAMTGYVQTLTDPSYAGQILVFTYPLVGNYGVPVLEPDRVPAADFQSDRVQVQGAVVQHLSDHFSHHRAARSLARWLADAQVPLLSGIDTRTLTRRLRESGTMYGWLFPADMTLDEARRRASAVDMRTAVFRRVAPAEPVIYPGGELRIMLVDVGAKDGIVECLRARGATVVRTPWHAPLHPLAASVDGIVIGNGPGDPSDLGALTEDVRRLLADFGGPIFGVCMGHQILGRAAGFATYKLPYGHRGVNQPVQDLRTGRCYVTSQNHGFAVDDSRPSADWHRWFVNLNDGTNEGLRSLTHPAFSVQFHPEGRPGPLDTEFLFDEFLQLAQELRKARRS